MSLKVQQSLQSGFSLIEVLVAVVVIAIGLLGNASIQALSLNNTSIARIRSLAALEADGLASVMHANTVYWQSSVVPSGASGFTITGNTFTVSQTPILPSIAFRSNYFYSTIQSAYTDALSGDNIYIRDSGSTENLLFDNGTTVTLLGGFDANYAGTANFSTINGNVTIQSGMIIVNKIIIKP